MKCVTKGSPLVIDESKVVGTGMRRAVYLHPGDNTKVIKVFLEQETPARRRARYRARRRLGWLKRLSRFDENIIDYKHYHHVMRRRGKPPSCICAMHGIIETNLGPGLVAERVCNTDGQTSDTLRDFILKHGLSKALPLLDVFFEDLAAHHIVARDLHNGNILVQETGGQAKLVLIEGANDPSFIRMATIFKFVNEKKLMRRKKILIQRLKSSAVVSPTRRKEGR